MVGSFCRGVMGGAAKWMLQAAWAESRDAKGTRRWVRSVISAKGDGTELEPRMGHGWTRMKMRANCCTLRAVERGLRKHFSSAAQVGTVWGVEVLTGVETDP